MLLEKQEKRELTAALANELWSYVPETGILTWKTMISYRCPVGVVAGRSSKGGYLQVMYKRKNYMVHRIAWLMQTGVWPVNEIDHVNGIPSDNRLINLREATHRQNNRNRPCHRAGQARFTNYHKASGKWRAQLPRIDGRQKHLGLYSTMEAASEAAERWLRENHPELN